MKKNLGWQPHTVLAAISRLRKGGTDVMLDQTGDLLTPSHASKGGTRYRYYVSGTPVWTASSERGLVVVRIASN